MHEPSDVRVEASRSVADTATLVLVRHGETAWNRSRRIQGHVDIALNDSGIVQAQAVAQRLSAMPIAAVHASDLVRALATAEAIARLHTLAVFTHVDLRERHWGRFQGMRFDEIVRDFPEAATRIDARDPTFALDGGESIFELQDRVRLALERIAAQARGRTVVVVTHGGVLDVAYRLAMGLPSAAPRTFALTNAAVNVVQRGDDGWVVRTWDDTAHLAALAQRDEIG